MIVKRALSFLLLALLAGCRIIQVVPEGGSIVSASGLYNCAEGQTCIVDVENGTEFTESFTAQPRRGYIFDGWKKEKKYLCGNKTTPCGFTLGPDLTSLEIDLYLSPVFSVDPDAPETLVFVATSASDSDYFNDLGLVLESSTQYIFRYNADTGEVDEVDSNYSPSYARSTIYSYTVDDRFYVRRDSEVGHGFTEYDGVTLNYRNQVGNLYRLSRSCSAMTDTGYFYKSYRDCDPFGCTGGDFRKLELTGGSGFGRGDEMSFNECYGHLGASEGILYDALYFHDWDGTTSAIGFYERNQVTGEATTIAEFFQPDGDVYQDGSYSFHYDGADIYIIRRYAAGGFEILRWRMGVDPVPYLIYVSGNEFPAGFWPAYRDVDDGIVAVANGDGFVMLLDAESLTTRFIDFDTTIYDMQVLYVED